MWRAFFLAVGIAFTILGAECLVVDEAAVLQSAPKPAQNQFFSAPSLGPTQKVVRPPEWAPWTFLSTGIVVILYSFTIPQRMAG